MSQEGIQITNLVESSIVGIGVTCTVVWSIVNPTKTITRLLEDKAQKIVYCTYVHLDWQANKVVEILRSILGHSRAYFDPDDIKVIVRHIQSFREEARQAGRRSELIYWDAITKDDHEWSNYAIKESNREFYSAEAFLDAMPIIEKKGQDRFSSGISEWNPPPTLSSRAASLALSLPDRPGSRSRADLAEKCSHSVKQDSSGYYLCEVVFKPTSHGANKVEVGPRLLKFIVCTSYYHPDTWPEKRAVVLARELLRVQ